MPGVCLVLLNFVFALSLSPPRLPKSCAPRTRNGTWLPIGTPPVCICDAASARCFLLMGAWAGQLCRRASCSRPSLKHTLRHVLYSARAQRGSSALSQGDRTLNGGYCAGAPQGTAMLPAKPPSATDMKSNAKWWDPSPSGSDEAASGHDRRSRSSQCSALHGPPAQGPSWGRQEGGGAHVDVVNGSTIPFHRARDSTCAPRSAGHRCRRGPRRRGKRLDRAVPQHTHSRAPLFS
jgi:hypothetical protein